ncbi:nuclear transport factor 2 family protein [Aggregatimonas sangjinii]|uniref:Nuclear transport factor 2 family protein n=1 Tax=Aggregatimonas sangjinii TaxID=2583587 RepID=A0A5B7SRH6_9FLAO|nr:nuclear transport factor 2 family protein [Aggregatimonas sangjinii]QCW99600.1 nuclear transport factor 2 family protein [Aggregatimonas sangjinii]
MKLFKYIFCFGVSLAVLNTVSGQVAENSNLYQTLKTQDSILFDAAFDSCAPEVLETIFTEDFEFYHDKGGLTSGRDNFLAPMRENCANWDKNAPQPSKRILFPNSLKVYPLYKDGELYGAIQHGIHRFESLDENGNYQKGDEAQFTHVWIKDAAGWKIKRELSYDHQYKPN